MRKIKGNYEYAVIGNCTSAALVSEDCSIDWLCLPFFDSPSLCAKILDKDKGGYFKITAKGLISIKQNYVLHTPILITVFTTKHGIFEIRDYMPRFLTERREYYCPPEIQRDIRLISGCPKIIIEYKLKPNYAISDSSHTIKKDFIKSQSIKGEHNSFYLYTNLDKKKFLEGRPIDLKESSYILLSYHQKLTPVTKYRVYVEYEKTKSYWLSWVYRTKVPERHKELVLRSAITLKLLMYQRTGAVIAAPTTSLPEIIGQNRNWDYRYCWVRDASMIIDLYARMGHMSSAKNYLHFILNRMLLKHENISVMYGINGEEELHEKILEYLEGYERSKPVRIGNDAYRQRQNDLYGELIEMIYTYFVVNRRESLHFNEEVWTVVRSLILNVKEIWNTKDSSIWEMRGETRDYVYSKMMSWVAMDRASKIAHLLGKNEYAEDCSKIASL
ncbi:glycoside hydrolase family 15 protein [bacterium]